MKLILPDEEVLEYNERILKGYGDEIALHREELRNEIADHLEIDAGQSFIMSGHQVSFFHPGILIKDTQAAAIALRNYGQAIHVSLDIDPAEIEFIYPCLSNNPTLSASKQSFFLGSAWFQEDQTEANVLQFEKISRDIVDCLK